MRERYVTITGMNYYYGMKPFSVGKKIRCIKKRDNCFDSEAIKVVMKEIGTVGYIANSPYTTATGTMSAGRIKAQNESIYYNVDKIQEAILANQKISFTYYKWNTDKELVARNGGKPFVISPWSLTWDDEKYYMLGYDDLTGLVKHYRVDKMQKINLTGEKRTGETEFDKFDLAKFAKSTFGMYDGGFGGGGHGSSGGSGGSGCGCIMMVIIVLGLLSLLGSCS